MRHREALPGFEATQTPCLRRRTRPRPQFVLLSGVCCAVRIRARTRGRPLSDQAPQLSHRRLNHNMDRRPRCCRTTADDRLNMPGSRVFFPQPNRGHRRWREARRMPPWTHRRLEEEHEHLSKRCRNNRSQRGHHDVCRAVIGVGLSP